MQLKIAVALGVVAVVAVIGVVMYPKLVVTLPNDGTDAKPYTFRAVRGQRYTEMFLIGGNAITKDVSELKDQYHVLASFKNGPRLWTLDWIDVDMGKDLDFGGLKARWVNWLDLKGISTEPGEAAYKNITVGRHTKFGFDKGKQVFLLDDPDGNSWAMKSVSLITYPDQKFGELGTLGSRLKLPAGWKIRAPVLEQDLVLTPDKDGIALITQDDVGNTYDRVGGPYSNFKP